MTSRDDSATENPSTSTQLLSKAREWDQEAWQLIVRRYGPLIYRWSQRWPLQPADREDLFQEIFRSVAVGLPRFNREQPGNSFRSWLWALTRNRAADLLRRHKPVGELPDESGIVDRRRPLSGTSQVRADSSLKDELSKLLLSIQGDFQEQTWRAFWESVIEQRPPADVAEELGISLNAVYHARSRVLSKLRAAMNREAAITSRNSVTAR